MRHQGYHPDLDAYFARIGWSGDRTPTWATLRSLHLAHATCIPFENIEVVLGGVPSLAPEDIADKLVRAGRGGYCFEHNLLLADVLTELGYGVTLLGARVRMGTDVVRPRSHAVLAIEVPGEARRYIADVGFGGQGLLEPLPLVADVASPQGAWRYRLVREDPGDAWLLQTVHGDEGWLTLYAFEEQPLHRVDYDVANWFIATHPRSPFKSVLRVQRRGPHERAMLDDRVLTVVRSDGSRLERDLKDDHEVLRVLVAEFGLLLPWDTTFPEPPRPSAPTGPTEEEG